MVEIRRSTSASSVRGPITASKAALSGAAASSILADIRTQLDAKLGSREVSGKLASLARSLRAPNPSAETTGIQKSILLLPDTADGLRAAMEINKLIDAKLAAAAKANRGISTTTHDIQLKLDLSALKAILKDKMETIGAHYTKETISGAKHAIAKMNAATPNELAQKTTDVTKQLTDMVRLLKAAKLSTTQAVELMKPVTEDAMRSFGARMTVLVSEISGERQLEKLAHLVGLAGALRDPILATIAPKDLISEMGSVHSGAQQAMSDSMKLLADAVSQKLTEARNDSANTIRKALAKTPPDYAAIKMERVRFETHDSEVTRGLAEMGGAATASTDLSSILDELKTEEKTVFKDTLSTRIRDLYKAFESNPKAVRAMFDDLVQRGKDLGLISLGTDGKIESTELPSKSISSLNKMAAGIRLADEFIALNATAAPLIKSFARGGRTSVSELTVVKTRLLNLNKGVNALKSDRLENGGPIVVFVNRVIMEDLEQRLGKVGVKGRASLTTRLSDCASAVAERETIFETARQLGVSADLKRIDNPTAVIDLDGRESLLRTLRTIAATSTDETNKAYAKQVVKLIGSTESQRIKGILAKIEAQFGPTVTLRNFNPEAYKHAVADLEQYSDRVVTDDDELDHGVGRFSSETISSERQRNIVGNKVEELEERLYEFEERLKSDLNKAVGQISAGRTDFDVRQFTAAVKAAKAGVAVLAKAGIITEFQKTEYNEKIHANVETALKSFSQIISKNYGTGADFGQINSALSQMEEVPGDITHPSWSADKASMYERAGQDIADVIHGRLQTAMNTASDPTILSKTIDRVFADLEKISPETRAKMGEHWKGAVQSIEYAIQSAIRDNASAIRHLGLPPAEVAPRFTACLALIESSKTALEKLKGFVSVASASVATSASRSGSSSPVPSSPSGSSPRSLPSVDSESDAELIGPATPSSVSVVSGDSGSASPIPDTKAHVIARVAEYVRRVADSLSFEGVVSSGLSAAAPASASAAASAPASAVPAAMPWSSDSLSLRTPSSVEDFQAIQTLIELCKSGGMPVDDLAFKEPLKAVIKSQLPKPPDLPEVGRSLDGAFVDQFLAFSKQLDALAGNSGSSSQATSEVIREHKASIAKEIVAQFGNFTSLETQYSSEDIRLLEAIKNWDGIDPGVKQKINDIILCKQLYQCIESLHDDPTPGAMPADRLVGYLRVLAENVHAAGLLPDGQSQVEIMQQQLKIEIGRLLSTKLEAGLTIASPHELGRLAAVPGQVMETFLAGAKTTISAGVKTYIQSLQTVPSGSAPGTSFQALWGDIVVIADAVRTLNGLLPEHAFMDQLQRTIEVRLVSELEADVQKVRWFQSHGTDSQGVKKDPATYYQNVAGKIRYMERAVLAFSAACKNDFSKGQVADAFNEFRKVADVAKFTDGIGAIIADPNFTFGNPAVLLAHLDGSMLDATMAGFGVEPIAERIKGKIVESFGQKISLALAKSPSADDLRNLLKEFNQIRKCVTLDPPTGESFTPGMLALRDALGECLDCVDSVLDKWVETHSVKFLNKLSQGEVGEGEWADLLGEVNRGLDDAGMAVDHGVALIRKNVTSWLDRQASDISNPIKAGQLEKAYSLLSKFGAIERYLDEDDPEDDDSLGESIRTVLQPVGAKKAEILRNIQSQVDLLLSIPNKSDIEQFLAVLKKCNGNDMGSGVKREFADMARSLAAKLALMSRDSFGLSNPMGQVRSDRSSDAGERLLPRGGQSPGIGSVVSWFRSARTASQRTASGLRETLPSIEPPFNGSYLPPLPVASPPASLPGVPDRIDAGGPGSRGIGLPDVVLAESPAAVPGGGSVVAASGPAIDLPGSTIMDNDDFQVVMVNSRVELRGGVAVVGTDRGIGYKDYAENQDRAMINPNAGRPILAVVDGMGGQADGEVAAKITNYCLALVGTNLDATGLQAAKEYLLSDLPLKVFPNTVFSSATPRERYKTGLETQLNTISDVESALRVANQIIIEYNNRKGYGDNGSGACLSTAEIDGDRCRVRSAGDAKLIVISTDGSISFETDDALKAFRDRRGFEDSGEVERYHRERNVVADAIGADGFRADDRTVTLSRGDVVIMASDGLWDNLTPEEVVQLTRGKTPDEAFSILSTATALASICAESGDANDVVKYHSFLRLSGFRSDQVPLQQPKADNRSLLIYRHEGTAVAQPQPPLVSAPASPPNTGPSPVGVAPGDDPVSPLPAPDVPTPGAEGQLVPEAVRFTAADLSPGYSCGKVDLGDSITNVVNLRTVLGVTISGKALTLEKFDVPENGSCGFYALAQTAQEPAVGRIEEEAGFGTVGTQAQAKLKMETADPETGMDPFRVSLLRDLGRFDAKATELQSGDATMFEKYTTGLLSQIHNKVANYTAESRRAVGTTKQRLEVARDAWCRVQEARERGESDGDVRKLAFVARLTELNSTTGSKPFDGQILSKEGMAEPDDILVLARLLNKPTIVLGNYDRVAGSDDAFNTMTALSSHPGVDPSECRIIAHSGGVHWVYLAVRRDFE